MFVMNVVDYENQENLTTRLFKNYDGAITAIKQDLEDVNHMNDDEPYLTKNEFNDIIKDMETEIKNTGWYAQNYSDMVYYVDEVEVED